MGNKIRRASCWGMMWPVLVLVLCLGRPAQADVATFVGSGCLLSLRVQDVTETFLTAEIKRADIERLHVGVSSQELYGDRFFIPNCADEFRVKLVSLSEEVAIVRLPLDILAALEVGPMPATAQVAPSSQDVEAGALQAEVTRLGREMEVFKAQTAELFQAGTTEKERTVESDIRNAVFGNLRGRMLVDGRPYAGCQVKLRRLTGDKTDPQLFDAVTDRQGVYRFEGLPEGPYDIYWMPPGKNYWVRLLKEDPTVVIRAGREVVQPDINADMRVL
ncbi:MAG: carboxypeptidase-like regulatory domain-containing protein [Dehalococcoidia bacterium]